MKQLLVILLAGLLCFQIYQKIMNQPPKEGSDDRERQTVELSKSGSNETEDKDSANRTEPDELNQSQIGESTTSTLTETNEEENNFNRQIAIDKLLTSVKLSTTLTDKYGIEFILVDPRASSDGSIPEFTNQEEDLEFPFYLQKTEMTQGNWEKIMEGPTWRNSNEYKVSEKYSESPNHPIYFVNYQDVHAFISKLNSAEATAVYRLPTQEEWEFAAKSSSTPYPEDTSGNYAWCAENASEPMPVGTLKANPRGFHDMVGNVWEWVMNGDDNFSGKATLRDLENGRTKQGGSWMKDPSNCNYASMDSMGINARDEDLGFRLVRDLPEVANYKSSHE